MRQDDAGGVDVLELAAGWPQPPNEVQSCGVSTGRRGEGRGLNVTHLGAAVADAPARAPTRAATLKLGPTGVESFAPVSRPSGA